MYSPTSFDVALLLMLLTAVCWGSWANSFKGTRNYPFELFYWDYILGVLLCSLVIAFTLGSTGSGGEGFLQNISRADTSNLFYAILAGVIFNIANVLLVAAIEIAGLALAFPIAIGIATGVGVLLSYGLQPKGSILLLAVGVVLAVVAVLFNANAHRILDRHRHGRSTTAQTGSALGVKISIISGLLMGGFAPFVARAMTAGHSLTPYSTSVMFAVGAVLCCLVFNSYLMKRPLRGEPVAFSGYWKAGTRNHALGILGGIIWGLGGCFNFIAAGLVGVPISYAIGQSAPLIAAGWGVFVWREFAGAPAPAWRALTLMALFYFAAICTIAFAYDA